MSFRTKLVMLKNKYDFLNNFYFMYKIYQYIYYFYQYLFSKLLAFLFILYLLFTNKKEFKNVQILTRGNHLGPCSFEVFQRAIKHDSFVTLAVDNPGIFNRLHIDFLARISLGRYKVVKKGSLQSYISVFRAVSVITFENDFETIFAASLRKWGMKKNIIVVPDGVVTKTQGNIEKSYTTQTFPKPFFTSPRTSHVTYAHQSGLDIYRVAVNCQVPSATFLRSVGMPRFSRAKSILNGSIKPVISKTLSQKLSVQRKTVLVALTKNYLNDDLGWFCHQLDCNPIELNDVLQRLDVNLWFKEHQSKFDYRDSLGLTIPSFSNIHFMLPSDCFSSVDLSLSFNMILTDISSVYIDLLQADIPIGFINFDHWYKEGRFCYPYRYFYPGKKINSFCDLTDFMNKIFSENIDDFSEIRSVARSIYLGNGVNDSYWDKVVNCEFVESIEEMEFWK